MASASQYGSRGGQYGSSSSPFTHSIPKAPSGSSHPHGHGILRNLLEDAITTAKGIPMGLVQTAEHPIRAGRAMVHSYEDTYGHGWGHFEHSFHAHPLQPLLDAISVPLILAGGAGVALKGADTAVNLGRGAEIASAMGKASDLAKAGKFAEADALRAEASRVPGLTKAADRFRAGTEATTRHVDTGAGFTLPYQYSTNMFRRFMTKGTDAVLEGFVGKQVGFFSTAGKGTRMLESEISRRQAGASSRAFGQVRALLSAKKHNIAPEAAAHALQENFKNLMMDTGIKVRHDAAMKLDPADARQRNFTYIAKDPEVTTPGLHMGMPSIGGTEARLPETVTGGGIKTADKGLGGYSDEQIHKFVETLGSHVRYTNDPALAHVDEHGMVTVVGRRVAEQSVKDISGAMKLAGKVYNAPLTVWKAFILGQSPRYLVNNVIGNAGMYAAATNPLEFSRGVLHAIKAVHGIRAAARAETEMGVTMDNIMAKFLPDEFVHSNMGYMQHGALSLGRTIEGRLASPYGRAAKSGLRGVVEKVAYRGPQRASIMGAMTTMPGFRALYRAAKAAGKDDYTAFQDASRTLLKDPRTRAALEKRTADWAGQYYHLNSLEQNITSLVPFYNWTRHALRFGKEQTLARPVQTAVLSQLGAMGDKHAAKELGNVPDFLKGAIPVGGHDHGILGLLFGQQVVGRKKIILTAGYNPLASAASDAQAIAALFGGGHAREAIGSQVNPVISGFLAGVTGQKLFSGAKANYSSPVMGALDETFMQLPQARLLKSGLAKHGIIKGEPTKTKKGEPTLYTKDARQQLSSILGLNERDFSPKSAERLYRAEQGIKSPRKRRKNAKTNAQLLRQNLNY